MKCLRNKNNKHLGIEVDPELHGKLRYIAKYEGRSANGQIIYLIRQCIKAFEEENGEIKLDTDKNKPL
ncbi:MAG: hypothetical protein U0L17_04465 [Acutalibacteraceae bacterium]|nr:hypothetical protein [Acutalibacteraceae bacterium]